MRKLKRAKVKRKIIEALTLKLVPVVLQSVTPQEEEKREVGGRVSVDCGA